MHSSITNTGVSVEFKAKENLLFPLIEMFTKMRRQQAADAFIWKEHVKVTEKTPFGFKRFILRLQGFVWDDLHTIDKHWEQFVRLQEFRNSSYLNSIRRQPVPNFTLHTRLYLCDVFDSFLLQQPFIKPLGLFCGHLRLIPGEQANVIGVASMFMGQRSGGERESGFRRVGVRETSVYRLVGLTCGWSATVWGSSRRWRAGRAAECRPKAEADGSTWFGSS